MVGAISHCRRGDGTAQPGADDLLHDLGTTIDARQYSGALQRGQGLV